MSLDPPIPSSPVSLLEQAPSDVLRCIFLNLSVPDVLRCKQTCRALFRATADAGFWGQLRIRDFGPFPMPASSCLLHTPEKVSVMDRYKSRYHPVLVHLKGRGQVSLIKPLKCCKQYSRDILLRHDGTVHCERVMLSSVREIKRRGQRLFILGWDGSFTDLPMETRERQNPPRPSISLSSVAAFDFHHHTLYLARGNGQILVFVPLKEVKFLDAGIPVAKVRGFATLGHEERAEGGPQTESLAVACLSSSGQVVLLTCAQNKTVKKMLVPAGTAGDIFMAHRYILILTERRKLLAFSTQAGQDLKLGARLSSWRMTGIQLCGDAYARVVFATCEQGLVWRGTLSTELVHGGVDLVGEWERVDVGLVGVRYSLLDADEGSENGEVDLLVEMRGGD